MNYLLLISLIFISVSALFSVTRQFQMVQQNSYFTTRYFKWVKNDFSILLTAEAFLFCINSLLFAKDLYIIQLVFTFLILVIRIFLCIKEQKKSIKKLKFTSRIKRLYITVIILFLILFSFFVFINSSMVSEMFSVIIFMFSFISPLLTIIALNIMKPIEKIISNWYINDAKKILNSYNNLTVIGITGSYGKTTTKFILDKILKEKYNVVTTPQSFNTPMGIVRTIRENLKPSTQVFICEMGAKNIGDIKEICNIVHPKYGIITSVGAQHLETFKNIDNVFKTKFELADEVLKNKGKVFVNGDSKEILSRIDKDKFVIYGTDQSFNCYAYNLKYGKDGSSFNIKDKSETLNLSSKLLGKHSVTDICGAIALALELEVKSNDITYSTATLKAYEHRLELKKYFNNSLLIDDAYNSNPEGCLEAVRVLNSFKDMKKTIITPGLIELGTKEYDCNYALGIEAAKLCDIIILVGKNRSKPLQDAIASTDFNKENLYIAASFKEAASIFSNYADNNSVVLIENDLPDNYLN